MRLLYFFILRLSVLIGFAQNEPYLQKEIQISLDNDSFGNLLVDQYYSQGIYARYRVLDTTKRKKLIKSIGLNHRIYTNSSISLMDVELFDRPYAGHLTVSRSMAYFDEQCLVRYGLELGVMGKASLAQFIQEKGHNFFGVDIPQGWKYQVNNSPIINGHFQYVHAFIRRQAFQLLSESNALLGTAFTNIKSELVFKAGKFFKINKSIHYGSNIGHEKIKSPVLREWIFFFTFGPEYVVYNSTIEGNIIGKKIHTY